MSSIPGLPTPGSDVQILITRVNSSPLCVLVELWGNFSQGKKAEYQYLAQDIQCPGEIFHQFEGNAGDQCLVQMDNIWYRCRIVSRHGSNYSVFLIDKAWMRSRCSASMLAWGKKEHFLLPPEVEFCVLANVLPLSHGNSWSHTAMEFLKTLPGKSVKAYVQEILVPQRTFLLHIPCISKLMYEMGFAKKLSAEMFKDFVLQSLRSPSEAVVSTETQEMPVRNEPEGPGEQMHKQPFMYPVLPTGTMVTVIVTEVTNPQRVFCQLRIFSQELKKLLEQLTQHYEGRLATCNIGPDMLGFPCAARGSDGSWYRCVLQQVFPANTVVEVLNVDYGMKHFVTVDNVRPLAAEFFRMPVATYICSLHGITDKGVGWTAAQIDYLRSLLLGKTVIGKFEYQSLCEGVHYVTLYGHGNTNLNNLFSSKESGLLECEKSTGDYSKLMCMSAFAEKDEAQKQSKTKMTMTPAVIPAAQNLSATPSEGLRSTGSGISFQTQNSSNESRTAAFMAHMFPIGSALDVNVSCIESPNDFWCQLVQNAGHLKLLMRDMQTYYASSQFHPFVETACVARHPDNGMWYRAHVINRQTPHADVLFVDYGEKKTVSLYDLRRICPAFLNLKGQAFRCSLYNPADPTSTMNDWDEEALAQFEDFVNTAASNHVILKCTIYAVRCNEQKVLFNIVDLETPFESVRTRMVALAKSVPPKKASESHSHFNGSYCYSTHNIKTGTEEMVTVTCVNGVNQFFCQLERNADVVEDVTMKLSTLCHQLKNAKPPTKCGTVCFAKYTDGHWYRGGIKAIKATQPSVLVHFVDYGDTLEVDKSDLLPVPREASDIMSVPVQAVECSLSDFPASVPREVNSWFESNATEHKFRALVVAKECGKLLVELYNGKTQLNSTIKKEFQIEMQRQEQVVYRDPKLTSKSFDKESQKKGDLPSEPEIKALPKPADLPSKSLTSGMEADVLVSHCNSPLSFYVQFVREEEDLFSIVEKLNDGQSTRKTIDIKDVHPGDLVQAEFPEDSSWYRAVVREIHGNAMALVEFVDFGNTAMISISKMCRLSKPLLKCPTYSTHCMLSEAAALGKEVVLDPEVVSTFKKDIGNGDKELTCRFIRQSGSVWEVSLEDSGMKVVCKVPTRGPTAFSEIISEKLEQVKEKPDQSATSSQMLPNKSTLCHLKPDFVEGQQLEAYVTAISGAQTFWCQFANSEELDKLTLIVSEVGNAAQHKPVDATSLSHGSPCIALYADDELWYRAQVISKNGDVLSILFVDYGDRAQVNVRDVREMPPELIETPPQAFLCELEGFDASHGSWDDGAVDALSDLIADKLLQLTVLRVTRGESHIKCFVQVECEGQVINETVKAHWKCFTNSNHTKICETILQCRTDAVTESTESAPTTTEEDLCHIGEETSETTITVLESLPEEEVDAHNVEDSFDMNSSGEHALVFGNVVLDDYDTQMIVNPDSVFETSSDPEQCGDDDRADYGKTSSHMESEGDAATEEDVEGDVALQEEVLCAPTHKTRHVKLKQWRVSSQSTQPPLRMR
ncbi:tudor domain-containing 6-like [Diretmus argenteus]